MKSVIMTLGKNVVSIKPVLQHYSTCISWMPSRLCQWRICSRQLSSDPLDGLKRPLSTWLGLLIRASTELWLAGPRTTIVCKAGCNRTRWGSGGWWGTHFSWACTWLEWAVYPEHLNWQEHSEQAQCKIVHRYNRKLRTYCTGGIKISTRWEAECKLCLKVTGVAFEVFVGDHHHHLLASAQSVLHQRCVDLKAVAGCVHTSLRVFSVFKLENERWRGQDAKATLPLLNEFAGDAPHAGAWENIPVKHAQLQLVLSLLQLPNHLVDELQVTLAVADEGIKQLRGPWKKYGNKISQTPTQRCCCYYG